MSCFKSFCLTLFAFALWLSPAASLAGSNADFDALGKKVGRFKITYYWVVFQTQFKGAPSVPLYNKKKKVLAVVTDAFARRVSMEGTGILRDGRVVNLHEKCKFAKYGWCFMLVDTGKAPFGYGSSAPLHPFRTLAVPNKALPRGTVVYLPDFDGMPLPGAEGGFEYHDGCFVVEDTGWSLSGQHIDIFALSEEYYRALHKRVDEANSVNVFVDYPFCPDKAANLKDPESWARDLLDSD
jgi:3D (Asp-Asp-Asp) domain-containing protein